MTRHYRTLFAGTLLQKSALSVGGNAGDAPVDNPFCRDGAGRLTLVGEGIAGAFIASARKLYTDQSLPPSLLKAQDGSIFPSAWQVFTSHPLANGGAASDPELRYGVGIRQATGAAAGTNLRDSEIVPRGTAWPFLLDVDWLAAERAKDTDAGEAEGIAAAVIREWMAGRCWLGRDVARGMGWMELQDVTVFRLSSEHVRRWPDSFLEPAGALAGLERYGVERMPFVDAIKLMRVPNPNQDWDYLHLAGSIRVGPCSQIERSEGTGYGLDALSIGGGGFLSTDEVWSSAHWISPAGKRMSEVEADFNTDSLIAMTCPAGAAGYEPYIPGGSLRGVLRHALSRRRRRLKERIEDPNAPGAYGTTDRKRDPVEELFGDAADISADDRCAASLLMCDSHLDTASVRNWQAAVLQRHAGDEFTGGVFESSKFDASSILDASFQWEMVIEGPRERVRAGWKQLRPVLEQARLGHVGLGGDNWAGTGWPRWILNSVFPKLVSGGVPAEWKES